MKCPNCGASFKGGRGRCPACGYRVQVQKFVRRCPDCRARVAEGAKTCLMCGASLGEEKSFLPRVSLSMVPPAPLLGGALGVVLLLALWYIKPWRAIQLGTYHTPTPTMTLTATPTFTPTATATATALPTETATPQVTTYIVRSGDTLSLIAAQFGVPVDAIMAANGLSDHMITVGQELLIPVEPPTPEANPEASETAGAETSPEPQSRTYVVQAGDNLSQIAQRFNVTLQAIMEANGISDPDSIREGQELVVPGRAASTETPGIGGPPAPTVSPQFIYPGPTLLGPPDGREFGQEDAETPILLNWLSVGLLSEEEWYSVTLSYVSAETGQEETVTELTKTNSYRVPIDLRPPADAAARLFEWHVAIVRLVETESEDMLDPVVISAHSEIRTFHWH